MVGGGSGDRYDYKRHRKRFSGTHWRRPHRMFGSGKEDGTLLEQQRTAVEGSEGYELHSGGRRTPILWRFCGRYVGR